MKIIKWLFIIVLVGSYPACSWDAHLSNYLFEQYCNEEGRTGQFIYERVGLGEEYFIPIPFTKEGVELHFDNRFLIAEGRLLIDKHQLMKDFFINKNSQVLLSNIGPIYSYESVIIRKRDGKILSKAVSLGNSLGWFARSQRNFFSGGGEYCPHPKDERGHSVSNTDKYSLIKNTFYK